MTTIHDPFIRGTEPAHHSISPRLAIVLQRAGSDRRGELAVRLRRQHGVDHVQVLTLQRPDWDSLAWGGLPTRRALGVLALARLCRPDLIVVAAGGGTGVGEPEARQGLARVADFVRAQSGAIDVFEIWLDKACSRRDALHGDAGAQIAPALDHLPGAAQPDVAWLAHQRWEDDGGRTPTGRFGRPASGIRRKRTGHGRIHRRFAEDAWAARAEPALA
jgi:hypothetical protein